MTIPQAPRVQLPASRSSAKLGPSWFDKESEQRQIVIPASASTNSSQKIVFFFSLLQTPAVSILLKVWRA